MHFEFFDMSVSGFNLILFFLLSIILFIIMRFGLKISFRDSIFFSLFVMNLGMVFEFTLFNRTPTPYRQYDLMPFWSYFATLKSGSDSYFREIVLNICLFIPTGFLLPAVMWNKNYQHYFITTVFFGFFVSVCIEFTQLFTRLGFFEFDDLIDNTLGTFFGLCLFVLFGMLHSLKLRKSDYFYSAFECC